MSEHTKQAESFASKYGVSLNVLGSEYKPMWNETQSRTVFKLKISRNNKSYTFEFGQSIQAGSTEPNIYDVLACITKCDVGSFEDFCSEFAIDDFKTYKAVCKEFAAVERLFSDCIEELQEIQ